jgi:hypothetical protein
MKKSIFLGRTVPAQSSHGFTPTPPLLDPIDFIGAYGRQALEPVDPFALLKVGRFGQPWPKHARFLAKA